MQPQGLLSQLNQSMAQGQPEISQISSSSPAGQPGLQPVSQPAMPDRFDLIHRAASRRGMDVHNHPQLQPMPNAAPQMPQASPQAEQQIPVSEEELLIKAITKRLDHHSKMSEKLLESFLPQPKGEASQ